MSRHLGSPRRKKGRSGLLTDRDWLTVIAALQNDRAAESRALASKLLRHSKYGRQIALLRLLRREEPNIARMQKATAMSRRTVFRYLGSLEACGVRLRMTADYRYRIDRLPRWLERIL